MALPTDFQLLNIGNAGLPFAPWTNSGLADPVTLDFDYDGWPVYAPSAPPQTLVATENTITVTAPTAVIASGPISLAADNSAITITAPTAVVVPGNIDLAASNNVITTEAPFAAIDGSVALVAGVPTITVSAPDVIMNLSILAGTPHLTITAPEVGQVIGARRFPLCRREMDLFSQLSTHAVPGFDYQDVSFIP